MIKDAFIDNIYDLKSKDFNKFQESILIIQNVGADVSDITKHIQKITTFIDADRKEDAKKELINYYMLLFTAPKASSKIDALKALCKDETVFEQATVGELYEAYENVKKKFLAS